MINSDYKKYENETDQQYIFRVCRDKELNGWSWQEISERCNEELALNYSESWYRRRWNGYKSISEAKEDIDMDGNALLDEIKLQRKEFEKEKVKFRDERNEYNRLLRQDARGDADFEALREFIQTQRKIEYKVPTGVNIASNNDMLVLLSDLHIGETFDNCWGKYDSDVAKERLGRYLSEIIETQKLYGSQDCYVAILGDLISNGLHPSIKVSDRENTIQQIILCSEMILNFILVVAKHFNKVHVAAVDGNHSRIEPKEKAILGERLDQIIVWYIKSHTESSERIIVQDSLYDGTINVMDIRGKKYVLCHGDYDNFTKNGVANLSMMINEIPYACLYGHMHTNAFNSENVVMIRGGSLAGSGDQYTVEKRLNGKPGQMMCVVTEQGIEALMPVDLSIDK